MSTIELLEERHDNIATARALHRLGVAEPTVLTVAIGPDATATTAVAWAILRALGKQLNRLEHPPEWADAERWLLAHDIRELVVLTAQHLAERGFRDLAATADRTNTRLVLVSTDRRRPHDIALPVTVTTLHAVLARDRRPRRSTAAPRAWPRVPRSPALRLRFDCLHTLKPGDFAEIDALLRSALDRTDDWLNTNAHARAGDIALAAAIVTNASNNDQQHIRRCALQIAFLQHGIALPSPSSILRPGPAPTVGDVSDALAHTSALCASRRLTRLLTGLPAAYLELIGGDQISETAVLANDLPPEAQPILAALGRHDGPLFARGAAPARPEPTHPDPDKMASGPGTSAEHALRHLLRDPRERLHTTELDAGVRHDLDVAAADGLAELRNGAYRASAIALYSTYQRREPPNRFSGISTGQTSGICPESQ